MRRHPDYGRLVLLNIFGILVVALALFLLWFGADQQQRAFLKEQARSAEQASATPENNKLAEH